MASHSRRDGSFQTGANNLLFPSHLKWFDKQHYHLFWDLSTAATFSEFSFPTENITRSHQLIPEDMHAPKRKAESLKCHEGHFTPKKKNYSDCWVWPRGFAVTWWKKGDFPVVSLNPSSMLIVFFWRKRPFLCLWGYVYSLLNAYLIFLWVWTHCCVTAVKLKRCFFNSMTPPTSWHPLINLPSF